METPKPKPPVAPKSLSPETEKSKPKAPYFQKNQPLRGHEGLMNLKKDLEKR